MSVSAIDEILQGGLEGVGSPRQGDPGSRLEIVCDRSIERGERKFGCLKDLRRIATRHVRLASHYLAAVCLAATVSY